MSSVRPTLQETANMRITLLDAVDLIEGRGNTLVDEIARFGVRVSTDLPNDLEELTDFFANKLWMIWPCPQS